ATAAAGGNASMLLTSGWNFGYIRRVNVMLDNIDGSAMVQKDKDHWRSVGLFFRALRYHDLIAAFGDVPWIEHAVNINDTTALFATQTKRDVVAANVLRDLEWAESHINPTGDGNNTINVNVVRALISRFGLFEGTWRKYHNLADANIYLTAASVYSKKLLTTFPTIMANYDDLYNSEDLTGKAGIILYKQYVANTSINSSTGSINPAITRYTGSTNWPAEVPKDAIESFLCTDGKPVSTSSVYQGDASVYNAFKNRDRRLYLNVIPPYRVKFKNPTQTSAAGASDGLWERDANAEYSYYIDLLKAIPGNVNKTIPVLSQTSDMKSGNVIPNMPHFSAFNRSLSNWYGIPQQNIAIGQMVGQLGYYFWKFYNRLPQDGATNNTQDCPLFHIEEVMLNYAEATFELGVFDQSVADITINKLRARANVANMVVANINNSFDAKRDASVDPVLWEIRRERRVELFGDGFRFNDLKRWKKGTYLNNYPLGVKINKADYGNVAGIQIDGGGTVGYVKYFNPANGWNDKFYLEPVPLQELVINPKLVQNPGW
ncbi:MAG TPA: RagB/SusD family nutrient uptake outer membrane protein, partial [Pedobacter sp.]|nr:RagB/SusD family nutrient uptake outer membrane protein [Pedobacter sp.]